MNQIPKKLVFICENLSEIKDEGERRTKLIIRENITFSLTDESVDTFDWIVREVLRKNNNIEKFSEKFVQGKIEELITRILKTKISVSFANKVYIQLMIELKSYDKEFRVLVPLSGIILEENKYSFGKITLLKGGPDTISKISSDIKEVMALSNNTNEEKEIFFNKIYRNLLAKISNSTISEFIVKAEPIRAKERALEETRRVLDVLRFSIPAIYHESQMVFISIYGESSRIVRTIPIISTDKKSFTMQTDIVGPKFPYQINKSNLKTLKKIGAIHFLEILKKDFTIITNFESTILNTLHWFSNHTIESELENKLLNLITSLECLLTPRDGNPIGTAIAEGVAIILGEDLDQRKKIKKRVKQLYGIRSGVSHGGKKAVLESDLIELRNIVGAIIVKLANRIDDFTSQKDLLNWIEEKKLS